MRLFVAIELPEAWREAARLARREIEGAIDRESASRLRWVEPSLLHLTLRFIGEVDEQRVAAISEALEDAAPVDVALSLDAAGTLGSPGRTQVVWLGVDGDVDRLAQLAARVEQAVVGAGVAADARKLRPHLTLARVHRRASRTQRRGIAEGVASIAVPLPSQFRATGFVLMRSELGHGGPRYSVLRRVGSADPPTF